METWKDIEGFPGYQVSDHGNVRSRVNNRHGLSDEYHPLKPYVSKLGYESVCLGRNTRRSIHRLVASAFLPNPNNLPLVRHMDDNPRNNHVTNIAWGTQTDNMQDCVRHGRLVGDTRAAINSRKKRVVAISKSTGSREVFESVQEAARVLNVWPQHICSVIQGKISQTGGFVFEYIDEEEYVYDYN